MDLCQFRPGLALLPQIAWAEWLRRTFSPRDTYLPSPQPATVPCQGGPNKDGEKQLSPKGRRKSQDARRIHAAIERDGSLLRRSSIHTADALPHVADDGKHPHDKSTDNNHNFGTGWAGHPTRTIITAKSLSITISRGSSFFLLLNRIYESLLDLRRSS